MYKLQKFLVNSDYFLFTELLWVLSRERTLSDEAYRALRLAKATHNLEAIPTRETIQTGCSKGEVQNTSKEEENDDLKNGDDK